ncbi:MAG: alpha/beta hydrolase, partial [Gammaproteobacteria bacterium]
AGYSDKGVMDLIGLRLKQWGAYVSWGQLVAASGMVGITYSCSDPLLNAQEVLQFVRANHERFNIDPERIGIWATSGNGPTALSLLTNGPSGLRFAVLSNTYMLDLEGDTTVADMAGQFGFAVPSAGKSVRDLDSDVPLFVVRSGKDEVPGLNGTIDRFIDGAIALNLPIRFVNLPDAPHSFDTLHDTEQSRATIRQIVAFMRASSQ